MPTSTNEAENLNDDERSSDGLRKITDRRKSHMDLTEEDRRTGEDRRSWVGRCQAADWRAKILT
jgi:hypothetical protein